ncbi:hypothetical protein DSM110093_03809 (plasmid) [Sulfitobacter sp. DSM 110093]|nr:hypothetical protein DSM110093_03548 [Sulfitobacter sp. DSM 110093]UOA33974.1 hypothetical protein DSM110093_03809 [Sulfitobacter sp. DSM 110093]
MSISRISLMAALASLSLAAACSAPEPSVSVLDRLNAPYVEAQHQFHFGHGAANLTSHERGKLNSFLQARALRSEDVLIITIPTSGDNNTDAARVQNVTAALSLVPSRIKLSMQESFAKRPLERHQIGLIRVARAEGIRVTCQPGVEDLGCANAINLAHMIHRPADILSPAPTARTAAR